MIDHAFVVEHLPKEGDPAGVLELALRLSDASGALSLTVQAGSKSASFEVEEDEGDGAWRIADAGRDAFAQLGLMGFKPHANATLAAVRIVVRQPPAGGDYTCDHPYFALYLDWTIDAQTKGAWTFPSGQLGAEVDAHLTLTAGISCIYEPARTQAIGARALQLRLDLDFIACSTGWFPLPLVELGRWPGDIRGLFAWLGGLLQDLPDPPDFPDLPRLPPWNLSLPLRARLPFGIRFREAYVILSQPTAGAGKVIQARAHKPVLEWKLTGGQYEFSDVDLALTYDAGTGKYQYTATLFEAKYPREVDPAPTEPDAISLPFGALELRASAWRLTAGIFGNDKGACPELVLEAGDVSLTSSLWSAEEPLWQADALRLHLRDMTLLTCPQEFQLFANADSEWRVRYQKPHHTVAKYSEAKAPEPPPDEDPDSEFPLEFIKGQFDLEGHLLVAWRQQSGALLDKLASMVPGLVPEQAGPSTPGDKKVVALEVARFGGSGGDDLQARIEWFDETAPAPAAEPRAAPSANPPALALDEHCSDTLASGAVLLTLPKPASGSTAPLPVKRAAYRLDLPLLDIRIAEPQARSILFYKPAGEQPVLSLLHLYGGGTEAAPVPVVHAAIDLSMGDGDQRELLPTAPKPDAGQPPAPRKEPPFLELGLAARADKVALAVTSWQLGKHPKVLRAYRNALPFVPLLADLHTDNQNCTDLPKRPAPPVPPLRLHPGYFGSPNPLVGDQWQLSIQAAVERSLRSLLSSSDKAGFPISFKITSICCDLEAGAPADNTFLPPLLVNAQLTIQADIFGDAEQEDISCDAQFRFDPSDMSLTLEKGGGFDIKSKLEQVPAWATRMGFPEKPGDYQYSQEIDLLGLKATFYRPIPEEQDASGKAAFLTLDLTGGKFEIALAEGVNAVLRYEDFGDEPLTFDVDHFRIGPGGFDIAAALKTASVKLKGLSNSFTLSKARLLVTNSVMRRLTIGGEGKLPDILARTPVKVSFTLSQGKKGGAIRIDDAYCELQEPGKPIETQDLRYVFKIDALSLRYLREGEQGRHWFFEISGSATFKPGADEFTSGLLENLGSISVEFVRAPLSDEFADHLEFIVELKTPKRFSVFGLFEMELRSFGFAPMHDFDSGKNRKPAIILGGQCEFADSGDVISAEIDFHRLYLGMPKDNENVPQIEFGKLTVTIRSDAGYEISGSVDSRDDETQKGFIGSGSLAIPGFPHIAAAFAFMRIREPGKPWRRAWFIAVEGAGLSYQLAPLPIYLRQAGLGFGYRMTLPLLAERPSTVPALKDYLLKALDQHYTLAKPESWVTKYDGTWAVALEGVFTLGTAQKDPIKYDAEKEAKLRTVMVQALAAMDKDGLVAGAKLWLPVSYQDFRSKPEILQRPLAKGFLSFSPSQQRLLAFARKENNAYYGPEKDPLTQLFRTILEPVQWQAAVLAEPGRLRGEIGWKDRLVYRIKLGPLDLQCRGGILYAVEQGHAVYGVYFSARGGLGLSAKAGGRSLGMEISAQADVRLSAQLMLAQDLRNPLTGTNVYARTSFDVNVRFSVSAWMRIKAGFVKITIRIGFSVSLQILVALELGFVDGRELGFKGRATVSIKAFGRRLRVGVHVGVNEDAVDKARSKMARFTHSMLDPVGRPPSDTAASALLADPAVIEGTARLLSSPTAVNIYAASTDGESANADAEYAVATIETRLTDGTPAWLLWIMPLPAQDGAALGFYPLPPQTENEANPPVWATITNLQAQPDSSLYAISPSSQEWEEVTGDTHNIICRDRAVLPVQGENDAPGPDLDGGKLELRRMIAGCYMPKDREAKSFPFEFTGKQTDLEAPASDIAASPEDQLSDSRLGNGPRFERQALDTNDPFDQALAAAIEQDEADAVDEGPDFTLTDKQWQDAALGNQGFLLKQFQQDIDEYRRAGAIDVSKRLEAAAGSTATVWHSGMVLLATGALPAWVRDREHHVDATPEISFLESPAKGGKLRPIVEPEKARLDGNNVRLASPPIAHFDEETFALSWQLDWTDGEGPSAAPGIGTDVESFVSHYSIELYPLGGAAGASRPLFQREVLPSVLLVSSKDGKEPGKELKTPYSFTIRTEELFGRDGSNGQQLAQVLAVVTPHGQAGEVGEPFTIVARLEPRLTPLPPDAPELLLTCELAEDEPDKDVFVARLKWQRPPLPNQQGIAATTHWELVCRKLAHVPLGHYPQAGSAAQDGTGNIGEDPSPRPGDLCLRFETKAADETAGGNVSWTFPRADADGTSDWRDHEGRPLAGTEQKALRDSLVNRDSAAKSGGHAWQLFLRAITVREISGKEHAAASSMVPLEMYAGPEDTTAAATDSTTRVQLDHFEWPQRLSGPVLFRPQVEAGTMLVPFIKDEGKEGSGLSIDYIEATSDERVVSASWCGYMPLGAASDNVPLTAFAGFRLMEASEDGLDNLDHAERSAIDRAREIAVFDAVDPAIAAATPQTLGATQDWQAWYPAQHSLIGFLAGKRARGDRRPLPDASRSWYSWSDAELVWPAPGPVDAAEEDEGDNEAGYAQPELHQFLTKLVKALRAELGDDIELVVSAGLPDKDHGSHSAWLKDGNLPELDPYGWASLWYLGLARELSARKRHTLQPIAASELLHACEECAQTLVKQYPELGPHLMLDIPLRADAGASASASARSLDDLALDRVQLALRPTIRPTHAYLHARLPQIAALPPPNDNDTSFAVQFLGVTVDETLLQRAAETLQVETISLAHLTFNQLRAVLKELKRDPQGGPESLRQGPAAEILVKAPMQTEGGGTADLHWLKDALETDWPTADRHDEDKPAGPSVVEGLVVSILDRPLSLVAANSAETGSGMEGDFPLWPHGRFASAPDNGSNAPDELYRYFGLEPSPDNPPEDSEHARINKAYPNWARRFFSVAPLDAAAPAPAAFRFEERNAATAAPLTGAVSTLAPSADGTFSVNRKLNLQWATTRSTYVAAIGRYDRLLGTMAANGANRAEAAQVPEAVTHYYLPRVRKVEPPQLLGERLVTSDDGIGHHELVFALHAEDGAQQSSLTLARKLDYRGESFLPSRHFVHEPWAARIVGNAEPPEFSQPKHPARTERLNFTAADASFLLDIPAARFGATSRLFRCEPYFYETTLRWHASAGLRHSAIMDAQLARPASGLSQTQDITLSRAEPARTAFESPFTAVNARIACWLEELSTLGGNLSLADHFRREAVRLMVRFPRYFESLDDAGERAQEDIYLGYGRLPDYEARLTLTLDVSDNALPLAIVHPVAEGDSLFAIEACNSANYACTLEQPQTGQWDAGLQLSCTIGQVGETSSASVDVPESSLARDPSQEGSEAVFAATALPVTGRLALLAPLAARLDRYIDEAGAKQLRLVEVGRLALENLRPLTRAGGTDGPINQNNLAVALRMIFDGERKAAALAATHGLPDIPIGGIESDLCTAIENAPAAALRMLDDTGLSQPLWNACAAAGLDLWALDATAGPYWTRLAERPTSAMAVIATVGSPDDGWHAALDQFLALALAVTAQPRLGSATILARSRQAGDAAASLFPGVLRMQARAAMASQQFSVWVQKSNYRQVQWGRREA
ncbi:hypothetical protein [Erythrobacter donghaensis]|uniref:hypothetical protein n=1 Tax=Erythrobacter donghaensis TaxID=267135 RepID=UPI000A3B531F|nr:hypothetical protein [Erythrobacter donghaensis]